MLSKNNKLIKDTLKLKQKKYRDESGKFIIEGARFVEEALNENKVEYIFYSGKFASSKYSSILDANCPKYEVEDAVIKELSDTETPQGIIAVCIKTDYDLEVLKDFAVIIDGVQDPGNLGTIIRTADAAGADAVIIVKGTVDVYNSKTLRSTMGSIFHLPVIYIDEFETSIDILKQKGFKVYATDLTAKSYIYDFDFKQKTAIIIGNEANGIPQSHIELATDKIKIPMIGRAESLNAAMASSILLYEVVRQRIIK
ncbi:23S rRNA (uridine(2479)-2'-O)-methyltransferase [Caloramator mitchellensis]|uniref:23S rRNA (Uridine(2479)-2'-O)-methyltransferase n=1 Tax=Caloramator mitchellensis TaxID=908809 RepID=A0A0R3JUV5_CALMK|nr:RNA methyltransferase [Caloramator mitchellensis]KRQ87344.1 23S rRNA (uridine(2479)-2'-O)-methyltransferase [Caloramator mitchellensis]